MRFPSLPCIGAIISPICLWPSRLTPLLSGGWLREREIRACGWSMISASDKKWRSLILTMRPGFTKTATSSE